MDGSDGPRCPDRPNIAARARRGFLEALKDDDHPVWDVLLPGLARVWRRHPPLPDGSHDPGHCRVCWDLVHVKPRSESQREAVEAERQREADRPMRLPPYEEEWMRWREAARARMAAARESQQ
jgi:hypothetical protein